MEIIKAKGSIVLRGKLIVSEIDMVHSQIEGLLDKISQDVILNLSEVEEIDTSGIQLLYALKKYIEEKERGSLQIKNPSNTVKEEFLSSGFDIVLKEDLG
jgi:anti-anti-sigma factor